MTKDDELDAAIDAALAAGVALGDLEMRIVDGQPLYRLTVQGRAWADGLIANDPEAQAMIASLRDATLVPAPTKP